MFSRGTQFFGGEKVGQMNSRRRRKASDSTFIQDRGLAMVSVVIGSCLTGVGGFFRRRG